MSRETLFVSGMAVLAVVAFLGFVEAVEKERYGSAILALTLTLIFACVELAMVLIPVPIAH
jgi:hypothetical protein